jgi:hypothetical protein
MKETGEHSELDPYNISKPKSLLFRMPLAKAGERVRVGRTCQKIAEAM